MKPKHQRLLLICGALLGLSVAALLMITAFKDTLVFFYTPSDLLAKQIPSQQRIRIGGLVKPDSVSHKGEDVHFVVTDHKETLAVKYTGLLPDLFADGQGVVAEGFLVEPGLFMADYVLAKHDENYMPKEVADRLEDCCVK